MKKKWVLCGILSILFLIILLSVVFGRDLFIDKTIINILSYLRNDFFTAINKIVTLLGDKKFILVLVVVLAGYLFYKKYRRTALVVCLNLFNIVILNKGIKYLVRRERPAFKLVEEDGYSFPSGHAMLTIGVYGLLIYLIHRSKLDSKIKKLLTILLTVIIIFVGYTRMYLGVHYPSDVIAGYLITGIYLIFFITLLENKFYKKN